MIDPERQDNSHPKLCELANIILPYWLDLRPEVTDSKLMPCGVECGEAMWSIAVRLYGCRSPQSPMPMNYGSAKKNISASIRVLELKIVGADFVRVCHWRNSVRAILMPYGVECGGVILHIAMRLHGCRSLQLQCGLSTAQLKMFLPRQVVHSNSRLRERTSVLFPHWQVSVRAMLMPHGLWRSNAVDHAALPWIWPVNHGSALQSQSHRH